MEGKHFLLLLFKLSTVVKRRMYNAHTIHIPIVSITSWRINLMSALFTSVEIYICQSQTFSTMMPAFSFPAITPRHVVTSIRSLNSMPFWFLITLQSSSSRRDDMRAENSHTKHFLNLLPACSGRLVWPRLRPSADRRGVATSPDRMLI